VLGASYGCGRKRERVQYGVSAECGCVREREGAGWSECLVLSMVVAERQRRM